MICTVFSIKVQSNRENRTLDYEKCTESIATETKSWNKLRHQQLKKSPSLIETNTRNKIDDINKNRSKKSDLLNSKIVLVKQSF